MSKAIVGTAQAAFAFGSRKVRHNTGRRVARPAQPWAPPWATKSKRKPRP